MDNATPVFRRPNSAARSSFIAALREYQAEGLHLDLDVTELNNADAFDEYVARLLREADPDPRLVPHHVPATVLWWMLGDVYLGRLSIRHELTDDLRRKGGHIGFEVRPSARGKGHAAAMLGAALPIAYRLGIDVAVITCDTNNLPCRAVIERNAGVLQEEDGVILQYHVVTRSDAASNGTRTRHPRCLP